MCKNAYLLAISGEEKGNKREKTMAMGGHSYMVATPIMLPASADGEMGLMSHHVLS